MKNYIKIQKNMEAIIAPVCVGFSFVVFGLVIMCKVNVLAGQIFLLSIITILLISVIIMVRNGEISKVKIDKKGVYIKEKSKLDFVSWQQFTDCKIEHGGRGIYTILLLTDDKKYRIIQSEYAIEKLIEYCDSLSFVEILKMRQNGQ